MTNRQQRRALRAQRGWEPLRPATSAPKTETEIRIIVEQQKRTFSEYTEAQIRANISECMAAETWLNARYVVTVRRGLDGPAGLKVTALSIRRQDRAPARDWRDFQRIKNQLVGPECEGVELYPAESRLVDTSHQWWCWVLEDPTARIPFGFDEGRRVSSESGGGAAQRPLEEEVNT